MPVTPDRKPIDNSITWHRPVELKDGSWAIGLQFQHNPVECYRGVTWPEEHYRECLMWCRILDTVMNHMGSVKQVALDAARLAAARADWFAAEKHKPAGQEGSVDTD